MKAFHATGLLALVLASACTPMGPALGPGPLAVVSPTVGCSTLEGLVIPAAAMGLPTSGAVVNVAKAITDIDPAGAARSFCQVTGVIQPMDPSASPIRFQVNLPDR